GQLPFDDNGSHPPPPDRETVPEGEALQERVASRFDGAGRPFMHSEPNDRTRGERQHRVERGQADHPLAWNRLGHQEQPVIPAGSRAGESPPRVAAETGGNEPLTLGANSELAARLWAELDVDHMTSVAGADDHPAMV